MTTSTRFTLDPHPLAYVREEEMVELARYLATNSVELLRIPLVREFIALRRLEAFAQGGGEVEAKTDEQAEVNAGTVAYNFDQVSTLVAVRRPELLLRPVLAIDKIANRLEKTRVLSIGPRTECELLTLFAHGLHPAQVSALDLFSYSPWIDVGDMSRMPYPSNTFDLVFLGWVLSYSSNPAAAAREILRVCRPGGVVAIGIDYDPETWAGIEAGTLKSPIRPTLFRNTREVLSLFGDHVDHVFFTHDAEAMAPGTKGHTIVVFDVRG